MRRVHPALALAVTKGAYIVLVGAWLPRRRPGLPWMTSRCRVECGADGGKRKKNAPGFEPGPKAMQAWNQSRRAGQPRSYEHGRPNAPTDRQTMMSRSYPTMTSGGFMSSASWTPMPSGCAARFAWYGPGWSGGRCRGGHGDLDQGARQVVKHTQALHPDGSPGASSANCAGAAPALVGVLIWIGAMASRPGAALQAAELSANQLETGRHAGGARQGSARSGPRMSGHVQLVSF